MITIWKSQAQMMAPLILTKIMKMAAQIGAVIFEEKENKK